MADMNTFYGPDRSLNTATGAGPAQVGGAPGMDMGGYLQALMAQKLQAQQEAAQASREDRAYELQLRRQQQAAPRRQVGMGAAPPAAASMANLQGMMMGSRPMMEGPQGSALDRDLEAAQKRDAILQIQARQNPAPMRMVTGPGIIPGLTMDTNAMNSYQRQAYLPKESNSFYSPQSQLGAQQNAANESAFGIGMALDRGRSRTGIEQPVALPVPSQRQPKKKKKEQEEEEE